MNLNLSNTREARFLPGVVKYCYVFTIALVLLAFAGANAQAPDWQWAKGIGGTGGDLSYSIAVDKTGNIYTTGTFSGTVDFDPGVGVFNLTSTGSSDIFISKYDNSGNFIWAKSAGGTSSSYSYSNSVATDFSGNIFITGVFVGPTITFGTTTLTNVGTSGFDIFLTKYDSNGNVIWAKSAGGNWSDQSLSVSTDISGNVFITGLFSYQITFGTTPLTGAGDLDIFIVKYDSSGNVLWAKSEGGTGDDRGYCVATDANGNIFITGPFDSPTITFGATTLTKGGITDIFIAKYDSSGNVLWAKRAGGTKYDIGISVATDASGNVFMTGYFGSPTIKFGTTTLTKTGVNSLDIFITKYNPNGNVLWAKGAGGTAGEIGYSVATDTSGNAFVSGYFASPTITFGTTTLSNAGSNDIFITKYSASGNVLWAKGVGGIDSDVGHSVCTNTSGDVFITGYFSSPNLIFWNYYFNQSGQ
ncbi:MAG: SBBP repeat-containing protein [Bacteroidetes bacterium]|nr:SBBP repeat-containing protein [Bacteroidota bacterium]